MPDARDAARAWLAERFHVAQCGCSGADPWEMELRLAHLLADAVLSAPGVEVWPENVAVPDPAATEPYPGVAAWRRVVIRLPAQPVQADDQSPA